MVFTNFQDKKNWPWIGKTFGLNFFLSSLFQNDEKLLKKNFFAPYAVAMPLFKPFKLGIGI